MLVTLVETEQDCLKELFKTVSHAMDLLAHRVTGSRQSDQQFFVNSSHVIYPQPY